MVLGAALSRGLEPAISVAGRAAACPNYGARLVAGEKTLGGGGGRGTYDTIGLDNPDTHDVEVASVEPWPHATTTMPHIHKDIPASQLHQLVLLDRSPVQTPAHTAAHTPASTPPKGSPSTSRCSTPMPLPVDRTPDFECMTIPP